jgi:GMP synthase-like glutamine amidotransferase
VRIGILQTGRTPEELREKHGDYDDLFKRLLAGRDFEFTTYAVLDGEFPEGAHAADGWLITGSKFGAYEDHAWIPPLEDFLRLVYSAGVPIVGVCFGHQILAQALGGKVEQFSGGWSVGAVDYDLADLNGEGTVMAWHRDQVVELPEGAEVTGGSDFCQYAMLTYGDRALTIQPHPEFTAEFLTDLLAARRDVLPPEIANSAAASVGSPLSSARIADRFEAFFKMDREGPAPRKP